ncbi:TonB-dependent receptor [Persicobacter diffluens]|uniref:SusC/RagA family TonB-linked outer membrane protein n=1 Tax=Persicobacter diffluens TaxID=981 RepID=A0AAN4VVW9_9BACT|nr:SusC/RagA family TonB-linked outer membrane protein [Persicobacter diffluens]
MKNPLLIALAILWTAMSAFAQGRVVTGTVTAEESGEPIPGVNVTVKGSATGTITDIEGKYSLNVDGAKSLVFSFIGLATEEVVIGNRSKVDMVMTADIKELEEVMVVAYGSAKKSSFTGSASKVEGDKIATLQTSSISKALDGLTSGVQTTAASGQPGEDAKIRIRGVGSINASSDPLIVVDGVPYAGKLNAINPQDVESMTVLKDAAAASLYGSRAANGVVMVTTKKGSKSATKVFLDAKIGVNQRAIGEYDIMKDPGQYFQTAWLQQKMTHGDSQRASDELISELGGYNPYGVNVVVDANGNLTNAPLLYNDDWAKETFRTGVRQEYNINFSGGSDKSTHYFSLGYLSDEGIVEGSEFERITMRGNIDHQVTNFLKVGTNLSYARGEQNSPRTSSGNAYGNSFMFTQNVAPIYPVYIYDGQGNRQFNDLGEPIYDFGDGVMGSRQYGANTNPAMLSALDKNNRIEDNFSGRGYLNLDLFEGLTFNANLGYDLQNINTTLFYNPTVGDAASVSGRSTKRSYRYETITMSQLLRYNKTIGDHNISALAGHESYAYQRNYLAGQKTNFFTPDNPELDNGVEIAYLESNERTHTIESYLANVSYDYKNKYFISGSFRMDGSSKFHPNNRWGNFWSVGGAWRINEEDFMSSASAIDNFKLKASYGTQGNDGILDDIGNVVYTPFTDLYQVVNNNNEISLVQYYKGNEELSWEKSKNFNIGTELTLFSGRLNIDFEYYNRVTSDLLFNFPVNPSMGYSYYPENIGEMVNKGVDFSIGGDIVRNGDFRWNMVFNGTTMKNEILSLKDEFAEEGITRGRQRLTVGGSIYDFYLQSFAGVDPETGNSLWRQREMIDGEYTGNILVTDEYALADRFQNETALADFFGSWINSFEYKGFDLTVITNFQIGGKVYDLPYAGLMHSDRVGTNWHKDILNAWTPENPHTDVPRLSTAYQDGNSQSDRFLVDASYFNIRNITLGYTVPQNVASRLHLGGLRVYVSGDNLALFSARKGMDPRLYANGSSTNGGNGFEYAALRTISGGLNITF